MKDIDKRVVILFVCRAFLWLVSLIATVYWIYWSFKLYVDGIMDEHSYATILRPKFYTGLLIAVGCLSVSMILRKISDKIRGYNPKESEHYESE